MNARSSIPSDRRRRARLAVPAVAVLALVAASLAAHSAALPGSRTTANDDRWAPFEALVGTWEGTGRGPAGESEVQRVYERVLAGHFLHHRTRSEFAGSASQPDGEIHEDWGMLSFDAARGSFVLREFYTEGFVNTFVLDADASDEDRFVFVSESSENAPPGMRARLTIERIEPDVLEEVFELAGPGEDFAVCVQQQLERVD